MGIPALLNPLYNVHVSLDKVSLHLTVCWGSDSQHFTFFGYAHRSV